MAIFLVDLQFREKAKNFLTSKEVFFVVFCLFLAMIPWIDIYNFVYTAAGGNVTKFWSVSLGRRILYLFLIYILPYTLPNHYKQHHV